jgi:hypothetical protein
MELAPSSIILTTLGGYYHTGEQICSDALTDTLGGMVIFARSGRREIYNPANSNELISEKWVKDERTYLAFVDRITEFRDKWQALLDVARSPIYGMGDVSAHLQELFGEPVIDAVKSASERVANARLNNGLYVEKKTGSIITAAPAASIVSPLVKARRNTFYGDEMSRKKHPRGPRPGRTDAPELPRVQDPSRRGLACQRRRDSAESAQRPLSGRDSVQGGHAA